MIHTFETHKSGVLTALCECFPLDSDLIEKWHIEAGNGLDACIGRTLRDVETTFDPSFKFYTIYQEKELVGYWGTEFGTYINLIFVKPAFRTREFMKTFWKEIQKTVADRFYTAVYAKNKPAIEFYAKHGSLTPFELHGHPMALFEFTKDRS